MNAESLTVQVEKLSPRPGDLLVVRVEPSLPIDTARDLRDSLVGIMPSGVRVVMLARGVEFSTMSDADLESIGLQRKVTP